MYTAMVLTALCNMIYLALHVTGSSSFPQPLSKEEEQECLSRIEQGDEEAKNELIEHNLRLVAHIVKKYDIRKEQKEETAQELAQRADKDKIEVTSQPSLPKTGQATSPWTLFGFLGLMLTSLLSLGKAHKDE